MSVLKKLTYSRDIVNIHLTCVKHGSKTTLQLECGSRVVKAKWQQHTYICLYIYLYVFIYSIYNIYLYLSKTFVGIRYLLLILFTRIF